MGLVLAVPAWLFGLTIFASYMRCIACINSCIDTGSVAGSRAGAIALCVLTSTACTGVVVPVVPVCWVWPLSTSVASYHVGKIRFHILEIHLL